MLSFNPYFRMTAFEFVVECKIFDSVRDKKLESGLLNMRNACKLRQLIELDIDSTDAFDYEDADNAKYSVEDLKAMLVQEIREINDKSGKI